MGITRTLAATLSIILALGAATVEAAAPAPAPLPPAPSAPPQEGLRLWLDAANQDTVSLGSAAAVLKWHSRARGGLEAEQVSEWQPIMAWQAIERTQVVWFDGAEHVVSVDRMPVIRFNGTGGLIVKGIDLKGDVIAMVVFRQTKDDAAKPGGQRILVGLDSKGKEVVGKGGLRICNDCRRPVNATAPVLFTLYARDVDMAQLAIGWSGDGGSGRTYSGDIAEILVYDRAKAPEDVILWASAYLARKWNAPVTLPRKEWTLKGALENPPKQVTDKYPLSDQQNKAGWEPYKPMTDEFNGKDLDSKKWWNAAWGGKFAADNVTVKDGELRIACPKDPKILNATQNVFTGHIMSWGQTVYGYYEIRARVSPCSVNSSFWFFNGTMQDEYLVKTLWKNEIDVFEEPGDKVNDDPYTYNMALHTASGPDGVATYPSARGYWKAPWKFSDAYHVYGLQWDEDWIRYYVDGVMVREVENTLMHAPQNLLFYTDEKVKWFGIPRAETLPASFAVDYVRAWKRKH